MASGDSFMLMRMGGYWIPAPMAGLLPRRGYRGRAVGQRDNPLGPPLTPRRNRERLRPSLEAARKSRGRSSSGWPVPAAGVRFASGTVAPVTTSGSSLVWRSLPPDCRPLHQASPLHLPRRRRVRERVARRASRLSLESLIRNSNDPSTYTTQEQGGKALERSLAGGLRLGNLAKRSEGSQTEIRATRSGGALVRPRSSPMIGQHGQQGTAL